MEPNDKRPCTSFLSCNNPHMALTCARCYSKYFTNNNSMLIPVTTFCRKNYYNPHFTDKGTEACERIKDLV